MALTKVTSGIRTIATNEIVTASITDANVTTAKIADNAVTLAKMAGIADGNLITGDANGDPAYVSTGSAGQVLTSGGAGVAPTMQDAASDFQFIETQTVSASATLTFAHTVAAGWDYIVNCRNVKYSGDASTANQAKIQLGTGGGPTFSTSGYTNQMHTSTATSKSSARDGITNGHSLQTNTTIGGTGAGETWSSETLILNPGANSETDFITRGMYDDGSGLLCIIAGVGRRTTAEVVTGIRVTSNSITMTTGEFTLFRRKLS